MTHIKQIWQLWGKYFMLLMRKTGLQIIVGSFFFSLGVGYVMATANAALNLTQDNLMVISALVGSSALALGMGEVAAEMIRDDENPDDAPAKVSKLDQALKEKQV